MEIHERLTKHWVMVRDRTISESRCLFDYLDSPYYTEDLYTNGVEWGTSPAIRWQWAESWEALS